MVETVGQRDFQERAVRRGLAHVAIRSQAVRHQRRADERRPVIHRLEIEERIDAGIDPVPAGDERRHRVPAKAIASRPKRRRHVTEGLLQCLRQPAQLGEL